MKVGDLVRSSNSCSPTTLGVVLDPSTAWVSVLFAGEIGKSKFNPADGVFKVRKEHLKVVSKRKVTNESR